MPTNCFWTTLRPGGVSSPKTVLDILDLPRGAEGEAILADWRRRGIGPRWVTLPDGSDRCLNDDLVVVCSPVSGPDDYPRRRFERGTAA